MTKNAILTILSLFFFVLISIELVFYTQLNKSYKTSKTNDKLLSENKPDKVTLNGKQSTLTINEIVADLLKLNNTVKGKIIVEYKGVIDSIYFDVPTKSGTIPLNIILKSIDAGNKNLEITFTKSELTKITILDENLKPIQYKSLVKGQIMSIKTQYDLSSDTDPTIQIEILPSANK